jgi:outer membrane cobalamin receptor
VELGQIFLETSNQMLDEVEIVNDRNVIDFQIDKKVIFVGKNMSAASLSAVEVLENVPSIRVDIEGNVSLRGSTGFTVLIDGKPTVLDPSDALRQIPASSIENIEIITNPSVRYEPDGTGGIINIITKKNRLLGTSGLFNVKAGSFGALSGDFLLNHRKGNANFFLGGDYGNTPSRGITSSERWTSLNDTTTIIETDGDSERTRGGGGLRLGMDWDITPRNNLSVGFRAGQYSHTSNSLLNYYSYQDPFTFSEREFSQNESSRSADYYSFTSSFKHQFEQKGHELMMQFNYSQRLGDEFSQNLLMDQNDMITSGTRTTEKGPSGRLEFKLDYTKPINEKNGLEAGLQIRNSVSEDATELYRYNLESDLFILQPENSNSTHYNRNIYALYGILKGEMGKLGYQAGIRGEYTYRNITSLEEIEDHSLERLDYYPTLHLSYQLPGKNQVMASYSRRIDRPRGYYLEPFLTWTDMYNVRSGNPALEPEYIDAMEVGFISTQEKSQFSAELYYRIKHNKMERIQEVYDEGILLHTIDNVGTDFSLGLETMYNVSLLPWWELTVMGELYDYRIESEDNGTPYEYSSFNWGTRLNNTFNMAKRIRLQLDGLYNSATITTQGEEKGYFGFNAAVRTDFLDRKLSLVLQARDLFSTMDRISIRQDAGFYNYQYRSTHAPVFALTVSYRLNNFKQNRNSRNDGGGAFEEL